MLVTILIVDDASFIREILKRLIEDSGMKVVAEAENGQLAVEAYNTHSPDIVLMDMSMPEKNGLEATKEILAQNPQAKIIGISTMDRDIMMPKAKKAGCVDYITKPFQGPEVIEVLQKHSDG